MSEALREFFKDELEEANAKGMQQGSDNVFDIQQKLKNGETKEHLIGMGYDKSIVSRAYEILFG